MRNCCKVIFKAPCYHTKLLCIIFNLFMLTACSVSSDSDRDGAPLNPIDLSNIKEPIPKVEPKSKYGNPAQYTVLGKTYKTLDDHYNFTQKGTASWYGTKFHGKRTSSGEKYDMYSLTGAHKTLPLPTYARITNLDNNKSIIIKINDRGPFYTSRIVDLSYAAAAKLGVLGKGTANVQLTTIDPRHHNKEAEPLVVADKNLKKLTPVKSGKSDKSGKSAQKQKAMVVAKASPIHPNESKSESKNTTKGKKQPADKLIQVQLGAFKDRTFAEKMLGDVTSKIDQPVVIVKDLKANTQNPLYKVQLGPFPATNLDDIKEQLASLKISNPVTIASKEK